MSGVVLQVSISNGGLPKYPIDVGEVGNLGIEGDHHNHPKFHGGLTRALLLICAEVIEELVAKGFPVYAGAMGENITLRGVNREHMRTGQRYSIGETEVELTAVRVPCAALDVYGAAIKQEVYDKLVKAGDSTSPRWAKSGFYCSITREGTIRPGDEVRLVG